MPWPARTTATTPRYTTISTTSAIIITTGTERSAVPSGNRDQHPLWQRSRALNTAQAESAVAA